MRTPLAGIVGGMGPEAGLDLCHKLLDEWRTAGHRGQPNFVLTNEDDIPDRTAALLDRGVDFVPAIIERLKQLKSAGASFGAIACNTVHARIEAINQQTPLPVLNMIELTCCSMAATFDRKERIGILGTRATIELDLFGKRLRELGLVVIPPDDQTTDLAHQGIRVVKRQGAQEGERWLSRARGRLVDQGATVIIMGCTEIPLAFGLNVQPSYREMRPHVLIDPTRILAKAMVVKLKANR